MPNLLSLIIKIAMQHIFSSAKLSHRISELIQEKKKKKKKKQMTLPSNHYIIKTIHHLIFMLNLFEYILDICLFFNK